MPTYSWLRKNPEYLCLSKHWIWLSIRCSCRRYYLDKHRVCLCKHTAYLDKQRICTSKYRRMPRQPLVREIPNTPKETERLWKTRYYRNIRYLKLSVNWLKWKSNTARSELRKCSERVGLQRSTGSSKKPLPNGWNRTGKTFRRTNTAASGRACACRLNTRSATVAPNATCRNTSCKLSLTICSLISARSLNPKKANANLRNGKKSEKRVISPIILNLF